MVPFSPQYFIAFALYSCIVAGILWASRFLIFEVIHSLNRTLDEKIAIARVKSELEASDVGIYAPPSPSDDRSPCPALNTLANHGYIPRSGRNITPSILAHALQRAYNISRPFALILAYGGVALLGQTGSISLVDLARHNRIEHNASLIHRDTSEGFMYAPTEVDEQLWTNLIQGIETPAEGLGVRDIARLRLHRERASGEKSLSNLAKANAKGEMAAVLVIFGRNYYRNFDVNPTRTSVERKVPLAVLESFLRDERLPDGWRPQKEVTLFETAKVIREIGREMGQMKKRM